MAPRLAIPVSANLDEFKRQMGEAAENTSSAVRKITDDFQVVGRVGATVAQNLARHFGTTALSLIVRWTAVGAAIIGTAKLIGSTVDSARDQLAEMVAIADKASRVKLSPEFFQAFTAAAKGSKEQTDLLEDALTSLFNATRPRLDTSVSALAPTDLKQQWDDLAQSITRALQILQGDSQGPLLFQQATDNDQKAKALLVTIRDLIAAGQQLEALNIAERAFGAKFAEGIVNGRVEIEKLISTIDDKLARRAGREIFDNETVAQAKELDTRLNDAYRTINENLHPSFLALGRAAAAIKEAWVIIVELMAQASNLLPKFNFPRNRAGVPIGPSGETDFMLPPGEQAPLPAQPVPQVTVTKPALPGFTLGQIRQAIGPTPAETGGGGAERIDFDKQVESINRHIAAIEADTAAIGQNQAAHQVLRAELALLQALEREGADVTNEQITAYAKLRGEMGSQQALAAVGINLSEKQAAAFQQVTERLGNAATAANKAKSDFAALNEAIQFSGSQISDIFVTLSTNVKDFGKTMEQVLASLRKALFDALLTGSGPLASILGTKTDVVGGTGGILGALFGGAKAGGGPVEAGKVYKVGERGTELFAPGVDGTIIPNSGPTSPAGSPVVPAGISTNKSDGGNRVVIENHGADVQPREQRRNNQGGFDFVIAVRSVVNEGFGEGAFDLGMSRFGAQPQGVRR